MTIFCENIFEIWMVVYKAEVFFLENMRFYLLVRHGGEVEKEKRKVVAEKFREFRFFDFFFFFFLILKKKLRKKIKFRSPRYSLVI